MVLTRAGRLHSQTVLLIPQTASRVSHLQEQRLIPFLEELWQGREKWTAVFLFNRETGAYINCNSYSGVVAKVSTFFRYDSKSRTTRLQIGKKLVECSCVLQFHQHPIVDPTCKAKRRPRLKRPSKVSHVMWLYSRITGVGPTDKA